MYIHICLLLDSGGDSDRWAVTFTPMSMPI